MLRSSKTAKSQWRASWQQRGIQFARSHVGMAVQAHEGGLLTPEALHRVCVAAAADFRRIWARYGGRHAGRNLGKALKHLNAGQSTPAARAGATLPAPLAACQRAPPCPALQTCGPPIMCCRHGCKFRPWRSRA
jgi:hypothetical protein